MILKKKQILTATLVIALGTAIAVNWYYTNQDPLTEQYTTDYSDSVSGNLGDSMMVAGTVADSQTEPQTDNSQSEDEKYFSQAKLNKEKSNDEIEEYIDEILRNDRLDESDKVKIQNLLQKYRDTIKSQTDCENLITAKVGCECIVIINDDACQVILKKNTLNEAIILQITEIIEKNTHISAENLTIIETK